MIRAINDYEIRGVDTTLQFGSYAIGHNDFVSGNFDTHFVEKHMGDFLKQQHESDLALAKFVSWLYQKRSSVLVLPEMGE